ADELEHNLPRREIEQAPLFFSVQPLARFARRVGERAAPAPGATALRGLATREPETEDEDRRDRQLLDQLGALFVAVDPLGEVVGAIAERQRLGREDPGARVLGIAGRLALVV